jgi:hypothetical protein
MYRLPAAPDPWEYLCGWPAWRGLRESLEQLRDLLRSAATLGGATTDLADAVEALWADPAAVYADMPADYRQRCALRKGDATPVEDLETELQGWLVELARWVVDGPALLEAGSAAGALGGSLTSEVPRVWQGRFSMLAAGLRQMIQSARRGGARPTGPGRSGPAPSALAPGPRPWAPHLVVPAADGYALVLPEAAGDEALLAAGVELTCHLLYDLGPDAFRLHLFLLTRGQEETDARQVAEALGATQRRAAAAEAARCYEAAVALRRVRLSLYRWSAGEGVLAYSHTAQDLWAFRLREYGQARLMERDGALAARGEEWAITPGPGSWGLALPAGVAEGLASLGLALLGEAGATPAGLALGALLALGGARDGLAVANREIRDLARLDPAGITVRDLWRQIRQAIRRQASWGWVPEPAPWHDDWNRRLRKSAAQEPETEQDRQSFLQASTRFRRED